MKHGNLLLKHSMHIGVNLFMSKCIILNSKDDYLSMKRLFLLFLFLIIVFRGGGEEIKSAIKLRTILKI